MKIRLLLLLIILGSFLNGYAAEIGGVQLPDSIETERGVLVLNGAGIRTKFFINFYVCGLYLYRKNLRPDEIITIDAPMAIRLQVVSGMITSEIMAQATREGFLKATEGNIAPIQSEIETFIKVFSDKINKNDVYDLIYIPAKGLMTYKNQKLYTINKGLAFKQALFGIWLCDNPVQQSLKEALLGR